MMEDFNFPFHTQTTIYPRGTSFKFGGGYEFSAKPLLPLQRRFKLYFNGVVWYLNNNASVDRATNPTNNAALLMDFYERHLWHKPFRYQHPVHGQVVVKFAADEAFQIPKSREGGSGMTEPFEITLVEQPL